MGASKTSVTFQKQILYTKLILKEIFQNNLPTNSKAASQVVFNLSKIYELQAVKP